METFQTLLINSHWIKEKGAFAEVENLTSRICGVMRFLYSQLDDTTGQRSFSITSRSDDQLSAWTQKNTLGPLPVDLGVSP